MKLVKHREDKVGNQTQMLVYHLEYEDRPDHWIDDVRDLSEVCSAITNEGLDVEQFGISFIAEAYGKGPRPPDHSDCWLELYMDVRP